jgi:large subunit ribosomal protein LX
MSESKTYKITGQIVKKQFFSPMTFSREITAAKQDHAVERIYAEMGSRHRAKRIEITIHSIEEVEPTKKGA